MKHVKLKDNQNNHEVDGERSSLHETFHYRDKYSRRWDADGEMWYSMNDYFDVVRNLYCYDKQHDIDTNSK